MVPELVALTKVRSAQPGVSPMAESCFIDRLPTEILREIFLFHYHIAEERPAKLLYVSRRWHDIARETQTLWSTLYLHICDDKKCEASSPTMFPDFKAYKSKAIHASSLSELLEAIQRLGPANFTLIADFCYRKGVNYDGRDLFPAVKHLISCRCTTLVVTALFITYDNSGLLRDLKALRTLFIICTGIQWWRAFQGGLFADTVHIPHLQRVTLRHGYPPFRSRPSHLLSVKHLRLSISDVWRPEAFERLSVVLQKTQTLSLHGKGLPLSINDIPHLSSSILHLELSYISPFLFASSAFRSLVVLFLERDPSTADEAGPLDSNAQLEFPSLRYILCKGSHRQLKRFIAPNLYMLTVRSEPQDAADPVFPSMSKHYELDRMPLQPKYVSLESSETTDPFIRAFLAASRGIVDLELVLNYWAPSLPLVVSRLSETSESGMVCPKLQNLMFTLLVSPQDRDFVTTSLRPVANMILEKRRDDPNTVPLKSLTYRIVEEWSAFDQRYGLGSFDGLWERGLRDGSEETWENERKRLLSREAWSDLV
ncbi:hypothetical protein CPB86DRAFT_129720 [Serendipita vermifera]|nr:hypothetical protein CPB86DRAFT_129720 [Serendipita vermifera]